MSRFARACPVWFVEEPIIDGDPPRLICDRVAPGLTVVQPHLPAGAPGFTDATYDAVRRLLSRYILAEVPAPWAAWLYTPMALPLLHGLGPARVAYDCMDELSAFLHAPPELLERERELLACADVVFTGGPSLYRAKRERHPAVHCFPSSVDVAHFARGRHVEEPAEQRALPRPRLGFYGVIDERLDRALIDQLAASRPDWQIVMVGPVVKIDPAELPRHPNLHYLGAQPYAALPAFLAGWDCALLPFARNASTRFISPTKTLEYMAAERPIVSTPITDVAEPYGDVVYLADDPAAFVAACARALAESPAARAARGEAMRRIVAGTSWDVTAASMLELLAAGGARRPAPRRHVAATAPAEP